MPVNAAVHCSSCGRFMSPARLYPPIESHLCPPCEEEERCR